MTANVGSPILLLFITYLSYFSNASNALMAF